MTEVILGFAEKNDEKTTVSKRREVLVVERCMGSQKSENGSGLYKYCEKTAQINLFTGTASALYCKGWLSELKRAPKLIGNLG